MGLLQSRVGHDQTLEVEREARRDSARRRRRAPLALRLAEPGVWLAVLFGSVLLLGGVRPWAVLVLAGLAIVGLLLSAKRRALALAPAAAVLVACAALCVLQCVPIPLSWLSVVDPASAAIWQRAQALMQGASKVSLSLEPESTRFEACKALLYAAVWTGAAALRRRWGLRVVLQALAVLGLLTGGLTALHRALSLDKVYGLYAPEYAHKGHLGPLMNPNSLGGLLLLSAFAGVGWALHRRSAKTEALLAWGAVSVLMALTVVSGSRGALVGLAVAVAAMLVGTREGIARSSARARSLAVAGGVSAVAAVVLSFLAMTAGLSKELWDTSVDKFELWRWGWAVASEHPWLGVGRGAFGAEVGRLGAGPGEMVFIHAENWVIEWLSGFGLVFGGMLVAAVLFALRPAGHERRWQASDVALWSGVLGVVAQNLTDLSLEVPGVAVPFLFALAGTSERTKGHEPEPKRRWHAGWPAFALVLALGSSAVWLMLRPVHLAHLERTQLSSRFTLPVAQQPSLEELGAAVLRHPGDAFLLRLGAQRLLGSEPARGLSWLNASLLQAPRAGRTYALLAQSLMRLGRVDQALLSLREAARYSPELSGEWATLAQRWAKSKEALERAVPDGAAGARMLRELAQRQSSSERRLELLSEALQRDPDFGGLAEVLEEGRLDAIQLGVPPCAGAAREGCLEQVGAALNTLEVRAPNVRTATLRGRWLLAREQADAAIELLSVRCPRTPDGRACLEVLLRAAGKKDVAAISSAAELLQGSCTTRTDCAATLRQVADLLRGRGESVLALSYQQRVAETDPSADNWLALAVLSAELGKAAEAERWFERASKEAAGNAELLQRIASARQRAGGQ